MKGICLTNNIKVEFESRICVLENKVKNLILIPRHERDCQWRCAMLCNKNEIFFIKNILNNASITDINL